MMWMIQNYNNQGVIILEYKLFNYMESSLEHILPNMLAAFPDQCTCDKCIMDIKAIALNKLPPKYVVTQQGEMYSRINEMYIQYETDIMKALVEAIIQVKKYSRHEKKRDF